MADFLAMGGYGGFVWPAYAVSALVISGLVFLTLRRAARARRRLRDASGARDGAH